MSKKNDTIKMSRLNTDGCYMTKTKLSAWMPIIRNFWFIKQKEAENNFLRNSAQ